MKIYLIEIYWKKNSGAGAAVRSGKAKRDSKAAEDWMVHYDSLPQFSEHEAQARVDQLRKLSPSWGWRYRRYVPGGTK